MPKTTNPVLAAVSELGNATRTGDQERIARARHALATLKLARAVDEALATVPPLPDDVRARFAELLKTGGASDA